MTVSSHLFCLSDHERVALGNEEGLFVIHVTKDGKIHFEAGFPFLCLYLF